MSPDSAAEQEEFAAHHRAHLQALLVILKAAGVRKYSSGRLSVEFGPTSEKPEAMESDTTRCRCKCQLYEHTNGLCLNGCTPETCAPPET